MFKILKKSKKSSIFTITNQSEYLDLVNKHFKSPHKYIKSINCDEIKNKKFFGLYNFSQTNTSLPKLRQQSKFNNCLSEFDILKSDSVISNRIVKKTSSDLSIKSPVKSDDKYQMKFRNFSTRFENIHLNLGLSKEMIESDF